MRAPLRTITIAIDAKIPAADPGDVVAHRWRKRFCTEGAAP